MTDDKLETLYPSLHLAEPIRSDKGLTLETPAIEYLYGGQFTIINPVDKTKLS